MFAYVIFDSRWSFSVDKGKKGGEMEGGKGGGAFYSVAFLDWFINKSIRRKLN